MQAHHRQDWVRHLLAGVLFAFSGSFGMAAGQASEAGDMSEAAARGDADRLKHLIAVGTSLDPQDVSGQTPLLLAVQNNISPLPSC